MDPILIAVPVLAGVLIVGVGLRTFFGGKQAAEFMSAPFVDEPLTSAQLDSLDQAVLYQFNELQHVYDLRIAVRDEEIELARRNNEHNLETIVRMDMTIDALILQRDTAKLALEQLKLSHSVLWSQFEQQREELEQLREYNALRRF